MMRIDFFEEFATKENLDKLKLIDFPSTLYVSAGSMEEFKAVKKRITAINRKIEVGYWPVLKESYWVSPFSYSRELKGLYSDLSGNRKKTPLKILLDLELPFLKKRLFFLNLFSFFKNKRLIRKLFLESRKLNLSIFTAEYPVVNEKKLEFLGISYSIEEHPHKKIIMFYSSIIRNKFLENRFKQNIEKIHKEFGEKIQVGLGTIAKGILGNEQILSSKGLDRDLSYFNALGVKNVVIFRLGGLNNEYVKIIKKYA